jgi:hypothetical protein
MRVKGLECTTFGAYQDLHFLFLLYFHFCFAKGLAKCKFEGI